MRTSNHASHHWYLGLIAALFSLCSISAAHAQNNIVIDGNFETPSLGGWGETFYDGQSFGPWLVGGNSIDIHTSSVFLPADGNQSVDLSGYDVGSLSQTLVTVAGQSYTLSFALAGNPAAGPAIKQMDVYWGESLIASPSFDITGHDATNMGWETLTYTVTATSSSTVLEFESLTHSVCGPALDSVVVEADRTPFFGPEVVLVSGLFFMV